MASKGPLFRMIDIRPVGHILGWLVLVLGLLMVPCILLDLVDGNPNAREFALTSVITIVAGAAIAVACAGAGPPVLDLRQGFLLTTGAWAVFPAVAGLPLILGDPHLSFTDAYFEMTSAMTTTGATVIIGLDGLARGALLWRMLVNWIGGMGVILLAIILLPILNVGGMQLLRNADFDTLDKVMPRRAIDRALDRCGLSRPDAGLLRRLHLVRHVAASTEWLTPCRPWRQAAWATTTAPSPASTRRRSGSAPSSCCSARCRLSASSSSPAATAARSGATARIRAFLVDLPRLRARPARRPRCCMAMQSMRGRCAKPPSTWPRSSPPPASPRPTTACGGRLPRRCSSAR